MLLTCHWNKAHIAHGDCGAEEAAEKIQVHYIRLLLFLDH